MKKRGKRLLSVILAASMMVQMTAFSVSADEGTSSKPGAVSGAQSASPSDAEKNEEEKPDGTDAPAKEETEKPDGSAADTTAEPDETKPEDSGMDAPAKEEGKKPEEPAADSQKEPEAGLTEAKTVNEELPEEALPAECICIEKCTEGSVNEDCPVCGKANANLEDCEGDDLVKTVKLEDYTVTLDDGNTDQDNEELFAGYVERVFYDENDGSIAYGNYGEDRLTGPTGGLYRILKQGAIDIAAGRRSNTQFQVSLKDLGITKLTWTAEELGVSSIVSGGKLTKEANDAITSKVLPNTRTALEYLLINCPYEMFWYNKGRGTSIDTSNLPISSSDGWASITLRESSILTYKMVVASAYQGSNEYSVNSNKLQSVHAAAANAQAIVNKYSENDDDEKLKAYFTEICGLVSYDYDALDLIMPAGYGDPWQIIHVFDNNSSTNVVCEGYSKAFQYLCDLSDFQDSHIACYTVSGDMGSGSDMGAHMWNIVTMEDGKNYMVDITNCDGGGVGRPDLLFLAGSSSGSARSGYTFTPNNRSVDYTYDPEYFDIYGEDILTLAGSKYVMKAQPNITTKPAPRAVYGQQLKDVVLTTPSGNTPGTWSWKEPDTSVGDVGSRTFPANFTPNDTAHYKVKRDILLTVQVSQKQVDTPTVTLESDTYDYTGQPITPAVTVKDGNTVIPASEYTVSYANNTAIGQASVTVRNQAGGNYRLPDSTTVEFTIRKADLARADIRVSTPQGGYVYDKTEKRPAVTVSFGGVAIDSGWYTVSYAQNIHAGNARVTIAAARDDVCSGTASATFPIARRTITATAKAENKVYDGKADAKVTVALNEGQVLAGDEVQLTNIVGAFTDITPGTDRKVVVTAQTAGQSGADYQVKVADTSAVIYPYEPAEVTEAIRNANEAKEGVQAIDQEPYLVAEGTRFVSSEELKALNDAIQKAENAKNNPLTPAQSQAAAEELNQAVDAFKEAIKTGTRRSSGGSSSGGGGGGGGGSSSGGGGRVSGGSSSGGPSSGPSQGTVSSDGKKGQVNSVTGIVTGGVNAAAGDGYSHWQQAVPQDDFSWKLQYADGSYAAGTIVLDAAGNPQEQVAWELINGSWYAFGADGNAKSGWAFDIGAGKWYYVDINSGMKAGWVMVGGLWYYLNPGSSAQKPFGSMYQNETTPDGYFVGADGSWDGRPQV